LISLVIELVVRYLAALCDSESCVFSFVHSFGDERHSCVLGRVDNVLLGLNRASK
jgi:hypothetical protein